MEEAVCRPLIQVLADVPDFRRRQGRRFGLASILALAIAATLCGYRSYGAMAEWASHYGQELARALGFTNGKTPSVGTLHTIFRRIDKQALERALAPWTESVLAARGIDPAASAVDGKTLRGSAKQGACDVHLLSAVTHALGLTVGQVAVDDKTNEIGGVQELLKQLVLEGRVVTMDALLTQRSVAQTVLEKGGTS
jgi:hypothetical protein